MPDHFIAGAGRGSSGAGFSCVAFDLDGTLYPNISLNLRIVPFLLRHQRLLIAMGRARKKLRDSDRVSGGKAENHDADFYELQAGLMGEVMKIPMERAKELTERLIYRGWEPHFKKIKLFPHVMETLEAFREKKIRLGLLSDFPAEIKLENLKIGGFWHAVLCSEQTGHLKPHPASFLELARRMDTPPGQILYVGNSVPYDVEGARKAGMKTALILQKWQKRPSPGSLPDFIFSDYRQLYDYVIN